MVRVTDGLALSPDHVTLYQTADPLLGHLPILIFHGPSTTANYTLNSSRVQVHVYSPAGFQSFPRLTISPSSPFYSVVPHLPRECQGDELYRGLAFGLFKYFAELPDLVKSQLRNKYPTRGGVGVGAGAAGTAIRRPGSADSQLLFAEQHAADLAQAMVRSDHTAEVIRCLGAALQPQHIGCVDVDFVLPPGAIVPLRPEDFEDVPDREEDILDPTLRQYGGYTPLVRLLGGPVFLPTNRLRRAPSRPTSLNRTKSFTRDQKRDLRMKLAELVDTEERYVAKLTELVRHTADEFRQTARRRLPQSLSPSEKELEQLFPRSADQILVVNSAFSHELRRIMTETDEEASHDMDRPGGAGLAGVAGAGAGRAKDPSGALAIARTFLEWFPRFTDCYQDYIRASQHFPQLLSSFLDQPSSFRQRVLQKGEQSIRSILIEPVQRLPRYSLLIDQIVGCLPMTHPALQPMLRARDLITNICSMDDPLPDKPHLASRLRGLVENWPADLEPRGRLIQAVDFVELAPPFSGAVDDPLERAGIFLLFPDCLVLINKTSSRMGTGTGTGAASASTAQMSTGSMTAISAAGGGGGGRLTGRELAREIEKPSPAGLLASMTNAAGGPPTYDLSFGGWHDLADVRVTESADGQAVWVTSSRDLKGALGVELGVSKRPTARLFRLREHYAGRAGRLAEDVIKARIEARFTEPEREDPCWTLRAIRAADGGAGVGAGAGPGNSGGGSAAAAASGLGLYAAVFQEGHDQLVEGRREPAPIRVVVDHEKGTKGAPVGHYGIEVVVNVSTNNGGSSSLRRVSMLTVGLGGRQLSDEIELDEFLPTLARRVVQLLSAQFNVSNPSLAPGLVSYHAKVLKSLPLVTRAEKTRSFLASSPVKLLSSLWNGSGAGGGGGGSGRTPVTAIFPPPTLPRSNSTQSVTPASASASATGTRIIEGESLPENPLVRLEQTFTGYVAALQARKGAIIGRALLGRAAMVDELAVNDLYNRLIESPYDLDASAELPVEVVFVAFEKFLRIAWREQMGLIMTIQALDTLQERVSKRVPGDFADFVNYLFGDMAPQNRRAFTALIKLLANLLEGCGNDGDRGALTVAFADLLVPDGGAQNYINLLDRLVDDCDRIFEEVGFRSGAGSGAGSASASFSTPANQQSSYESSSTSHRTGKSSQTGSLTSNASSLRRKLGFDALLRQNSSKSSNSNGGGGAAGGGGSGGGGGVGAEEQQQRPSVWRSLSKHGRHPATGDASNTQSPSLSKGSVSRSRSIDMGHPRPQYQLQHHHSHNNGYPAGHHNNHSYQSQTGRLFRRPSSRDRPPIAGAFDDFSVRPGSSHRQLETIGEPDHHHIHPHHRRPELVVVQSRSSKKKRRSSLSDLRSLLEAATLEAAAAAAVVDDEADDDQTLRNVTTYGSDETLRNVTTYGTDENVGNVTTYGNGETLSPLEKEDGEDGGGSDMAEYPTTTADQIETATAVTVTIASTVASEQPPQPLRISKQTSGWFNSSPRPAGLQSRIPISPGSLTLRSPPQQKENVAEPLSAGQRPQPQQQQPLGEFVPSTSPVKKPSMTMHAKTASISSGIPMLRHPRGGVPSPLSPVDGAGAASLTVASPRLPLPSASATTNPARPGAGQRLRLQSPQKLRERLQTERAAADEAGASLQSELSRIAEDMARLNGAVSGPTSARSPPSGSTADLRRLSTAVKALEERIPATIRDLGERQDAARADYDAVLRATETKVRHIDQLYKEAAAENELLYERFNSELAKIVRAVRGKGREDKEDLVGRLAEQSEEAARLKKENTRLRREMASLRAMVRAEPPPPPQP